MCFLDELLRGFVPVHDGHMPHLACSSGCGFFSVLQSMAMWLSTTSLCRTEQNHNAATVSISDGGHYYFIMCVQGGHVATAFCIRP